ncbi:hypothetical protein [Lacrimispora sp.]|uniref:hypothetical protein n=1 Tax=Lacrimispora sp. TaxID=2719234 RepID=UPI0028A64C08|nr:hypothetical protein [Lacrimispora sp.]
MTEEVRKYAEKCMIESNIRMVPGHCPEFDNKEQVDLFLKICAKMSEAGHRALEEFQANIFDLTDVDINEYQELLDRLKRNKEKVPLEILTTKYKKSYGELKESIRAMTKDILQDVALDGLRIEQSHAELVYVYINAAIKESGILEKIGHAVFHQYDAEQVLEYASQLREMVHQVMKGREENAS